MNNKTSCLAVGVLLLALSVPAEAQHPTKVPKIGYLSSFAAPPARRLDAFRLGLKDFGYIEGKNILVEYRHSEGHLRQAPDVVAELVRLQIDVIVATDPTAIRAAKQATKTIPIVMLTNQDPVSVGLEDSLSRPGGNVTGLTRLTRELSGKRLELLKEVIPRIARVGILRVVPPRWEWGPVPRITRLQPCAKNQGSIASSKPSQSGVGGRI